MRQELRQKEESGKERRRLSRMTKDVEKDVARTANIKGQLRGLEQQFKSSEKGVDKMVKRAGSSITNKMRREETRDSEKRQAKSLRHKIRRDERKKQQKAGFSSLKKALQVTFEKPIFI